MKKNYIINKKSWLLLLILMSGFAFGQTTVPYNTSGTYTFTVPVGVTSLKIEAWGAGQDGIANGWFVTGGGGGGGAFAQKIINVMPGTSYKIVVGANGAIGGNSTFALSTTPNTLLVKAEGGGQAGDYMGGRASNSVGDFAFSGGRGFSSSTVYGGGGGSAGSAGNGNPSTSGLGGSGGAGVSGSGGNYNSSGIIPGGGGGELSTGADGRVVITFTQPYLAQIISADTGSTTWCAGETRNVTVTIKNIGSQPWTDVPGPGGKDFNIGIKWNQNTTSWNDYNVRVDAGNLAAGATATYNFTIKASNNLNETVSPTPGYTTPLAAGTNNLTFDVVYEGVAWFGNNNNNGVGPGNTKFTTPNQTIVALPDTPTAVSPSTPQSVCSGASVNLNATSTGNSIVWYTSATGGTAVGTSASGANFSVVPPVGTTTYYAESKNANGCVSSSRTATAVITVNSAPATPGFITGNANQCAGNTGQIYSIAPVANATGYAWSVPAGWSIISGLNTTSITVSVGTGGGNIFVNAVNSCGTGYANGEGSGYKNITVSPPTVAGTLTPANTVVCGTNNSTNLNLNGNVGAILRWESSTDNFSGGTITPIANTGSPFTAQNVAVDTYYRAVVQSGGCALLYSNSVKITHLNNVGTPGAISGSAAQCAGSTQIFSVDPVADATSYIWTVDNASGWSILSGQGTNSITVKIGTSSANVSVNATNSCSTGYGPYKYITVSPNLTPSVNIASNQPGAICAGTSVTFTASPTNGGTSPTYQWMLNGATISGANSSAYTATTLANNDKVSVTMTSNVSPCSTASPVTSNVITMTVNPNLPASVNIAATATTVCAGTSVTFTATPTNGGTSPTYQWRKGGINITGATSATYTTTSLSNNDAISVVMTSNASPCSTGSPVTSNLITMTVNPNLPASVNIAATATTVCAGTSVTFTATPTNGGTSPTYQWRKGGANITGATSATYTTTSLANNDAISVVMTSNASPCSTGSPVTSNLITMTVNPNLPASVNIAATATTVCAGTSVTFTATPTYGGTAPSYQWKVNTVNVGTNSATFTSTTLANNDKVTVVMTSNASPCSTGSPATSNLITMTVNHILTASVTITTPTNIICVGANTPITFTAAPSNGGTTPSYQWRVNGSPVGSNSATFTTSTSAPGDVVTVEMTSNANPCLAGSPTTSNAITMATQTTNYISGTGWTVPPAPNLSANIQAAYSSGATNLDVCALTVSNNAPVVIKSGYSFKVQNAVNVTSGSLTVESDANLVQIKDGVANTGNITSKREFNIGAARDQYNYVGTPVAFASGQSFKTIFPGSLNTTALYHNQSSNTFSTSSGANVPGRGLAVKEPPVTTVLSGGKSTAEFTGVPQNGTIVFPIVNSNPAGNLLGYNLVGNPYPSNIDLRELYNINGGKTGTSPNISATFYFWNNNGNKVFQQQGNGYSGNAYAIFNVLSGIGTPSSLSDKIPTQTVKVGQGFMTRSLVSSYNFVFNNTVRTDAATTVAFLGKGSVDAADRYWLQLTAPAEITSTVAVVHFEGGNDQFGPEDSRTMGGSDVLYTIADGEKLAIEGRSSFQRTAVIPLGTQTFANGNYTLGLYGTEGIFAHGQNIYLKDRQNGVITNLSQGSYSFAATAGESSNRFEIIYEPETVLATASGTKDDLVIYRDGGDFVVKAQSKKITALEVYDGVGRLIYAMKPDAIKVTVSADQMVNGVYVLKINQGGKITSKKVIR